MTMRHEEMGKGSGDTLIQIKLGRRLCESRLTGGDSLLDLLLMLSIITEGSLHFLVRQRKGRCGLGRGMATKIIADNDPDWRAFVADGWFFPEMRICSPVRQDDIVLDQYFGLEHRPVLLA